MKEGDIITGSRSWIWEMFQDGHNDSASLFSFYDKKYYFVGHFYKDDPQFFVFRGKDEAGQPVIIRELKPGFDDIKRWDLLHVCPPAPLDGRAQSPVSCPAIRDIVYHNDKSYYISEDYKGTCMASIVEQEGPLDFYKIIPLVFALIDQLWMFGSAEENKVFINPHSVYMGKDMSILTPDFFFQSKKKLPDTIYHNNASATIYEYYIQAIGALVYYLLTRHDVPEALNGHITEDPSSLLLSDDIKIGIEYSLQPGEKNIFTFLSLLGIEYLFETEDFHDGKGRWFLKDGNKHIYLDNLEGYKMDFYERVCYCERMSRRGNE